MSFTPLRRTAILPPDAVVGQPYSLPDSQLCRTCRDAVAELSSAEQPLDISEFRHHPAEHDLGTFGDLQERKGCPLCQLVATGLAQICPPYARPLRQDEQVYLTTDTVRSEEIHVSTSRGFVGTIEDTENGFNFRQHTLPENTIASVRSVPCTCCTLPKRMCHNSSSQIDSVAVCAWIKNCESNHQRCRDQRDTTSRGKRALYPSILVDVNRACLVLVNMPPRYCALSYVYGGRQIFKTSKANFKELQQSNSLSSDLVHLPVVIRDAIAFTARIGERYLWTDALCIIHDDQEEHNDQIECMDIIYSQAVITLAIVSGEHADQPIPGVLPHSRNPLPSTKLWDRNIVFCPVPVHLELRDSPYEQRAWTLQERLLSPRILLVTNSGVSFSCRERSHLEFAGISDPEELESAFSLYSGVNPLNFHFPLDDDEANQIGHEGIDGMTPQSRWTIYFDLVRIYSQRKLTYESDILIAFSGIQVVLSEKLYHTPFFAGIPNLAMTIALHWIPGVKETDDQIMSTSTPMKRRGDCPSFSWIGWTAPVQWLEAVCLPKWWQFEENAELNVDPRSSHLNGKADMTSWVGFSTEICKEIVYPERLLNPGDEYPLPLIKVFDLRGRWCGRLCDCSTASIDSSPNSDVELLLLSTCAARAIRIWDPEGEGPLNKAELYRSSFDTDVFQTSRPDGTAARLVNLLLVKPVNVTRDSFHRVALCQIHEDVWQSLRMISRGITLE